MRATSDHMSAAGLASRRTTRAGLISLVVCALLAVTLFTPAIATSGGDDIESVRATVTAKYNHKIDLLTALREETASAEKKSIYQGGINELVTVRDTEVAVETSIDALWMLKDRAHAIYHDTVNQADAVAPTAAEALAEARQAAHDTIEYKIGLLRKWIEGCDDPGANAAIATGIAQLTELFGQLDAVTTPDGAYAIKDTAHAIYHATIDAAEHAKANGEAAGGDTKPKPQPKPEAETHEKTDAERAAETLEHARRETLTVISRKSAILKSAAAAALIPAVVAIYENAATDVEALAAQATVAETVGALSDITNKALEIYETAKGAALEVRDDDTSDPVNTIANYLDGIANYVTRTTEAAAQTSGDSPSTFAQLVNAKEDVLDAVEAVRKVADSGNRLDDRWGELNASLSAFRLALVRHYIALGEPLMVAGVYIPG